MLIGLIIGKLKNLRLLFRKDSLDLLLCWIVMMNLKGLLLVRIYIKRINCRNGVKMEAIRKDILRLLLLQEQKYCRKGTSFGLFLNKMIN